MLNGISFISCNNNKHTNELFPRNDKRNRVCVQCVSLSKTESI